jgi:hypothetical protein
LEYRFALERIGIMENDPSMHVVLKEPVVEIGLPEDTSTAARPPAPRDYLPVGWTT